MKKITASLFLSALLIFSFALSALAAAPQEKKANSDICILSEDMTEVQYGGKIYKLLNENVAVVNGEETDIRVNASKTVTDRFEKIEATLYQSADYMVSVTFDLGFTETVSYFVREDKYTDIISIPNEFTASIYNIGFTDFNLTYAEKIAWRSDCKLHTVSPDLISFDESFSMISSDDDGIVWFNAGEVCRTRQKDGSYKYYMIDYAEYDTESFDSDGMLDFSRLSEIGKSVNLLELTDSTLALRITEGLLENSDDNFEDDLFGDDDYYGDYEEDGIFFGPMSDLAIAIICGIFFAVIPIGVAAVCFGLLRKKPFATYSRGLKLVIISAGVVMVCYITVLLILAL